MKGEIDTSFTTAQKDMFASGLAAEIGPNAYAVWTAVKVHANYSTGDAWPGINRLAELVGVNRKTVMNALKRLEECHLMRSRPKAKGKGRGKIYVARERLDVRVGRRLLCTVVVDYVPNRMKEDMELLERALSGDQSRDAEEVLARVDILPGKGFAWNPQTKSLQADIPVSELPPGPEPDMNNPLAQRIAAIPKKKSSLPSPKDE